MKNVSRSKFLLCFRPVVDMDLMLESKAVVVDCSQNHQALTYMKPSTTKSSGVSVSDAKNSIMIRRPGKKTFSKVIKAVVFEIMLTKRVRDRKGIDQESYSSKHNFPLSSPEKLLDASFGESVNKVLAGKGIQDTISKSISVSSTSCCSSSSSSSSSSTPNSTQKAKTQNLQNNCNTYSNHHQEGEMKPKQEGIYRGSSSNSAIFLVLISLAVTIFWGKFCAILFTSIWLYFLSHQQPTGVIGNLESIKRSSEKKSRDDKKKVIMEGLLERNHNRGALNF